MTDEERLRKSPRKAGDSVESMGGISKTILNFDINNSYIEEEDSTFLSTETSTLSEEIMENSSIEDDDESSTFNGSAEEDSVLIGEKDVLPSYPSEQKECDEIHAPEPTGEIKRFLMKHEIPRKVLHSSIGVFSLWLYTLGVSTQQLIMPLCTLFVIVFANDFARFHYPEMNRMVVKHMWFIIREKEVNAYNGVLFYLAGLILVFSLFPKDICLVAILLLSWADTAASTFGRRYGKYTPKLVRNKSLAGSLASFFTGVFSCYLIYGHYIPAYDQFNQPSEILWRRETSVLNLHLYAFLTGVIASLSELMDIYSLDDNFTIPVLSSAFIYGLLNLSKA